MRRCIGPLCLEPARSGAVTAATHADNRLCCINGYKLNLLAPVPVGPAFAVQFAQADIVIARKIAAHVRPEQGCVAYTNFAYALFGGHVVEDVCTVEVQPVAGMEPAVFITRIASVAVEVQENQLFRMALFESCEKVNIVNRPADNLLFQDLALDPHKAVKGFFPSAVRHVSTRSHSLGLAEEKCLGIVGAVDPQLGPIFCKHSRYAANHRDLRNCN